LDRWFKERWIDVCTGKPCGRKKVGDKRKYPYCRPSRRVSSQTPKTSKEISRSELKRRCAIKHRIKGKRISFGKNSKKTFLYKFPKKSKIDKNPNEFIKYKTIQDVKNTINKLERLYKSKKYTHKRIKQVAMIMNVRLRVLKNKKPQQYALSKKYFDFLGKRTKLDKNKRYKLKYHLKGKRLSFGKSNNFKLNSKFPYEPTASLKRIHFKNIHNEIKKMDPNMRKNDICPICLEELSEGRNRNNSKSHLISWQPCGHIMHRHCIIKLMRTQHANCPLCRADYEGFKVVKKLSSNFGKKKFTLNLTSTKSINDLRKIILSTQPDDCLSWDDCKSWLYFISKKIDNIKNIQFSLKREKYTIDKIPSNKFNSYIKKSKGDSVSFYSPSGTLLVIPRKGYINLMDFTFNASPREWVNLWKKVAKETKKIKKPFYISTHGHSVNWLHIRLEKNIRFK
jgi:hypothetical protein